MLTRFFLLLIVVVLIANSGFSQTNEPYLQYKVYVKDAESHTFHMELNVYGLKKDTAWLKLPVWMPGYYQIMNYASNITNIKVECHNGKQLPLSQITHNTWQVSKINSLPFVFSYDLVANNKFVANSYVDKQHAYIAPVNNFFFVDGGLNWEVSVELVSTNEFNWKKVATGLEQVSDKEKIYKAPNFDILYDCPILAGELEKLKSFEVNGIPHHFVGYLMGEFDRDLFIKKLEKAIAAAVSFYGDIPYNEYTFIAIGPGYGGIEHLNNTTVSFDGNRLTSEKEWTRMLNFLIHEYYHNYNVKRIRPFELGPFNYEKENRTTQLWISEGITVYYEYLIAKKAGFITHEQLLSQFEDHINGIENNAGRKLQTLEQASYNTWEDGPFGIKGKTMSYYEKGPIVALFLDLAIRNATENNKSLNDVMRYLYYHFFKEKARGFTDAEFQEVCETIADTSLNDVFEYLNSTKELDYNKYMAFAGLKLEQKAAKKNNANAVYKLEYLKEKTTFQQRVINSWLNQ